MTTTLSFTAAARGLRGFVEGFRSIYSRGPARSFASHRARLDFHFDVASISSTSSLKTGQIAFIQVSA